MKSETDFLAPLRNTASLSAAFEFVNTCIASLARDIDT
jgi:hypothetical protein